MSNATIRKEFLVIYIAMNPFAYESVAERYARGRRNFHDLVVTKVHETLNIERVLSQCADYGIECYNGGDTYNVVKDR